MTQRKPNFLIIVADDLGFSDTSPYGAEIETPNLAKLASSGLRMTNFHTAPACSPTRAMLMSGTDNHIAGLGQMAEHMRQNPAPFEGKVGYEGYLNFRVAALPEILKEAGYDTIMSGKWHLGMKPEHSPHARGFQKVFSFLAGSGNHYSLISHVELAVRQCLRAVLNWLYYRLGDSYSWSFYSLRMSTPIDTLPDFEPQFDDPKFKLPWRGQLWMENDRYVDRKKEIPENFYSTRYTTQRMMEFLKGRTPEEKEKPFLAYLAYLAPHWPLQAPEETCLKYRGWYDDGPGKLAEKRVKRLIELGLVPADVIPAKPEGHIGPEWDQLTDLERAESARKMEVYAAMVDEIDQGVGEVISYLEETGELDNTFVTFISDNGAEGLMMEALHVMGDGTTMADIILTYYDNSLNNIGKKDSFTWYGPRWASAATAPSRGWKAWPTEGGIRCPCIVRYPPFGIEGNSISHSFTTVMDILPTVLELSGVKHPGRKFQGRDVVDVRGKSWAPHLGSKDYANTSVHGEDTHVHGWELIGLQAIRRGPWKAVWMHEPRGRSEWELFNLNDDPSEQNDLAKKEPERMAELMRLWEQYYAETGMINYPFEFWTATA